MGKEKGSPSPHPSGFEPSTCPPSRDQVLRQSRREREVRMVANAFDMVDRGMAKDVQLQFGSISVKIKKGRR